MTNLFVPPTIPLNNYPGQLAPYSNVTPFTDRDYRTFVGQLEGFIAWLNRDVILHVNNTWKTIGERLDEFTNLTAIQQAKWQSDVNAAIAAYQAATGTDIAKYEAYFSTTVDTVAALRAASAVARTGAETARAGAETARDQAQAYSATTQQLQDAAVAALLGNGGSLPSNATTAALVKSIRALFQPRQYPTRFGFMGDSITDSGLGALVFGGQWWGVAAGDNYWPAVEAGVSGETTTSMLARIRDNFPAGSIDVGMILGGTNDVGQAFPLSTTIANITAMVEYVRSIGAVPILGTIPPRAEFALVDGINKWVRDYANVNNITVVDFYAVLTDPSTKLYRDGLTGDGIHPTPKGHKLMATAFKAAVSQYTTKAPAMIVPTDENDTRNAVVNGFIKSWPASPDIPTPTLSAGGSGSPLTAGRYYYKVAYLSYSGESVASAEASITITAGQIITLTAQPIPGQGRLVIYRSTTPGDEIFMAEVNATGAATVYADNGSIVPNSTKVPSTIDRYVSPTNWASGTGLGGLSCRRVTNDTSFVGEVADFENRSGPGLAQMTVYSNLPVKWDNGDVVAVTFKVRSLGGQINRAYGHFVKVSGGELPSVGIIQGSPDVYGDTVRYYAEVKLTADVSQVGFDFATDGARIRVGDAGMINLTKLGLR